MAKKRRAGSSPHGPRGEGGRPCARWVRWAGKQRLDRVDFSSRGPSVRIPPKFALCDFGGMTKL